MNHAEKAKLLIKKIVREERLAGTDVKHIEKIRRLLNETDNTDNSQLQRWR